MEIKPENTVAYKMFIVLLHEEEKADREMLKADDKGLRGEAAKWNEVSYHLFKARHELRLLVSPNERVALEEVA